MNIIPSLAHCEISKEVSELSSIIFDSKTLLSPNKKTVTILLLFTRTDFNDESVQLTSEDFFFLLSMNTLHIKTTQSTETDWTNFGSYFKCRTMFKQWLNVQTIFVRRKTRLFKQCLNKFVWIQTLYTHKPYWTKFKFYFLISRI